MTFPATPKAHPPLFTILLLRNASPSYHYPVFHCDMMDAFSTAQTAANPSSRWPATNMRILPLPLQANPASYRVPTSPLLYRFGVWEAPDTVEVRIYAVARCGVDILKGGNWWYRYLRRHINHLWAQDDFRRPGITTAWVRGRRLSTRSRHGHHYSPDRQPMLMRVAWGAPTHQRQGWRH